MIPTPEEQIMRKEQSQNDLDKYLFKTQSPELRTTKKHIENFSSPEIEFEKDLRKF